MLEEVGHSAEDIMNHVSSSWPKKWKFNVWNTNNYYLDTPDQLERHLVPFTYNDWQIFTLTDAQNYGGAVSNPGEVQEIQSNLFAASPKHSQVGSIHYPPNSLRGTDYAFYDSASLANSIVCYADDWYNYPFFTGKSRKMNGFDWGAWINYTATDPLQRVYGDRRAYLCWWFDHIPKNKGIHNGILNNWWPYLLDLDQFDGSTIDYKVIFPDTAVQKEKIQSLKTEYATEADGVSSWGYWCVEDNGFKVKFEKNNGVSVKGKASLKVSIVSLSDPVKLIYPSSKKAGWNLSKLSTGETTGARYINFYAKLENIKPESFISANPVVSLCNDSGNKIVLSPSGSKNYFAAIKPDRNGWYYFHIPIAGNSSWTKTSIGKPDLSKINYIELEIRADTATAWDSSSYEDGYSICLDGLSLQ